MMINSVSSSSSADQVYTTKEKTNTKEKETQAAKDESGVVVDIGKSPEKSATYSKPVNPKPNAEEIKRLWHDTDKATQSLRNLVEKLIGRQGKKIEDVLDGKEAIFSDEEARAEAEKMLSDDGEWGIKAVSTRIVDFAKNISGGDKNKLENLKEAIKTGFKEAEKAFGGTLPDICQDTYDEVMKQLDQWEKEE
ncbi:MAG: hypothetical protein N2484_04640 [Clostridia bacterium]|nr:hypothetical protein [Clostridia bacterium]